MFAYCSCDPVNYTDSEGGQPVRNNMLMTADSGLNVQYKAYTALKTYQDADENVKNYLKPAAVLSYSSSTSYDQISSKEILENDFVQYGGSIRLSAAHGDIDPEDSRVSISSDVICAEGEAVLSWQQMGIGGGVYLLKESISIDITPTVSLEFSLSIGFGGEINISRTGIKVGATPLIGGGVSVVWDNPSHVKYWNKTK